MPYPTLFTTPGVKAFAEAVDAERGRQLAKFGDQWHPDGTGGSGRRAQADGFRADCEYLANNDCTTWFPVLLEEVYEAGAEDDPAQLRAELVQVAAVCAAWINDLDRRPTEHADAAMAMADQEQHDYAAEVRGGALIDSERQFLEFALDLAADKMAEDDGFTDEDTAALVSLRRMADAARPDRVPTRAQITDQVGVVDASLHCVDDLLAAARPDDTSGA